MEKWVEEKLKVVVKQCHTSSLYANVFSSHVHEVSEKSIEERTDPTGSYHGEID